MDVQGNDDHSGGSIRVDGSGGGEDIRDSSRKKQKSTNDSSEKEIHFQDYVRSILAENPERKDKKGLNLVRKSNWHPYSITELRSRMQTLRSSLMVTLRSSLMETLQRDNSEQKFLAQLGAGGFLFEEFTDYPKSSESFMSCDFSTDGKFLACAGGKTVAVWVKESSKLSFAENSHSSYITEIRFRPDSTMYGTSSDDGSVRIWEASQTNSISVLNWGTGPLFSLDFHPGDPDILCSCDGTTDTIQKWSISNSVLLKSFRGGSSQVRFRPPLGKLLAAASGHVINIFRTVNDQLRNKLEGHTKDIISMCWDNTGSYLASVSEDEAHYWPASVYGSTKSLSSIRCKDGKFKTCIFHPECSNLVIIGGTKCLEFWIPGSKQTLSFTPDSKISGLAASPQNALVASVGRDCLKLWKCGSSS